MTDSCCGSPTPSPSPSPDSVRDQVREGYARIAVSGSWSSLPVAESSCCAPSAEPCCEPSAEPSAEPASTGGGCCGPTTFTPEQLATAIGYSKAELASAPEGANLGLSCGNPTALASLKPGEIVLDLGAGGGFDCFVAGPKVGATGRVIGVDMTPEMLVRARANMAAYREHSGLDNVEFRLGEIEHLPVADASVDVVISNCVLNLSPDKAAVWKEIARVLKPGGRAAISDLALRKPIPEAVRRDVEALVGCVSGAPLVEDTRRFIAEAGLRDAVLTEKREYVETMTSAEDPLYVRILAALPPGSTPADYVTSLDVSARKG